MTKTTQNRYLFIILKSLLQTVAISGGANTIMQLAMGNVSNITLAAIGFFFTIIVYDYVYNYENILTKKMIYFRMVLLKVAVFAGTLIIANEIIAKILNANFYVIFFIFFLLLYNNYRLYFIKGK